MDAVGLSRPLYPRAQRHSWLADAREISRFELGGGKVADERDAVGFDGDLPGKLACREGGEDGGMMSEHGVCVDVCDRGLGASGVESVGVSDDHLAPVWAEGDTDRCGPDSNAG